MKPTLTSFVAGLIVTAAVCLLGGCATSAADLANEPVPPAPHYIIGPGDSLQIFVRDNPALSATVPVRPDGRISIPLVQSIMAAGKTPEELAQGLDHELAKYLRDPLVTVIVKQFVGAFNQQVRVVGQAATPKAVPYRRGMSLLDVMIEVGGLTKFADGNDAKIVRTLADGGKRTIKVHLADLMDGSIKDNLTMRPGDILIIPQSMF